MQKNIEQIKKECFFTTTFSFHLIIFVLLKVLLGEKRSQLNY